VKNFFKNFFLALQNEKDYEFLLTARINGFFVTLSPAELKI
jgi:hypothetical protein